MGPGRNAPIQRTLIPLVVAGLLTIGLLATGSAVHPLAAQQLESASCPTMTDSVNRLYRAFYNRAPDGAEFRDATNRYRAGEANLESIAAELAQSAEFETRYGTLTDERYVELVYRNVLRREPEPADRDFWIANLESGYPRGSVMMAFSESEEFIRRTGTATPLAGYLRWYPEGVHWYCGVGPRSQLSIRPLTDQRVYADFLFHNSGVAQSNVGLQTTLNGAAHLTVSEGSLPPGFSDYKWGGLFNGDGDYGTALNIRAGRNTSWVVVFYPTSIGGQRLGWQLES